MGRSAKIKKWKSKAREFAERAEAAAERAEAAADRAADGGVGTSETVGTPGGPGTSDLTGVPDADIVPPRQPPHDDTNPSGQ
ncbi:MAG: hypothetical protein ACRDQ7_14530 [Haloechinothrix sp.]